MTKFRAGLIGTTLWLGLVSVFVAFEWSDARLMKPNEWADFFSGAFAPLAFLWLILGYLQQGDELQLSTKALQLQADELRQSVEQQRELVAVSRMQVEAEVDASRQERVARSAAMQPQFVLAAQGVNRTDREYTYGFSIVNRGSSATNVVATVFVDRAEGQEVLSNPHFVSETEFAALIRLSAPFPETDGRLIVSYVDGLGQLGQYVYRVSRTAGKPDIPLTFTRVFE